MTKQDNLAKLLQSQWIDSLISVNTALNEVTLTCGVAQIKPLLQRLRDCPETAFDQLMDLCVVDYLLYGVYDWETNAATENGFSRGVGRQNTKACVLDEPRFAVVYHLLSTVHNHRLRVMVFVEETSLKVPSVHEIWKGANWFEREAYDLFGLLFEGHPDLRRILTDYGFIGHPFRKDFPLSGHVEMRYDALLKKVIYEPVDIDPRITVPKVIRDDNRYSPYLDTEGAAP
jgi:NADH-quinone oxidoreductase subunit C